MTPSVLMIVAMAGVLSAAGIALLVVAWRASAARLGAGVAVVGKCGGHCRGCGYSTDGLEEPVCPECGGEFVATARRVERRRRALLAVAGMGMLGLSLLGFPASHAAQYGVARAAPNAVLIAAMRWWPSSIAAIGPELRVRAESGLLREWERRELARACEGAMGRGVATHERREAAGVLASVGREATDAMVMGMLRDSDASVRLEGVRAACGGLGTRSGSREASAWVRQRLVTMARTDRSATVRKLAVDSMRIVASGEEARSTLAAAMNDPNDGVRRRAIIGLVSGGWDDGVAAAAAIAAAGDVHEDVRWLATWMMARLAQRSRGVAGGLTGMLTSALVGMALGDEDEGVRVAAREAIRALQG